MEVENDTLVSDGDNGGNLDLADDNIVDVDLKPDTKETGWDDPEKNSWGEEPPEKKPADIKNDEKDKDDKWAWKSDEWDGWSDKKGEPWSDTIPEPPKDFDGTPDEWNKMSTDWREKFVKQSSSNQQKIQKAFDDKLKTEEDWVTENPDRLVKLAESDNDKDVSIAKQLAKKMYNKSLREALQDLKKGNDDAWKDEDDNEKEDRIRKDERRKAQTEIIQDNFKEKHKILDPKNDDYDEAVAKNYEDKLKALTWDEILTREDTKDLMEDAYYLATKHLSEAEKSKKLKDDARKVWTAWWWVISKSHKKDDNENPFVWMKESL